MATILRIVVGTLFVAVATVGAHGQVLHSNFGPNDSFADDAHFAFFSTTRQAMRFVPAASGLVSRVDLGMSFLTGVGSATVWIAPEVNDAPGDTILWTSTNTGISSRDIYSFNGPVITLTGGQPYWVVLQPGTTNCAWWMTEPAVAGMNANFVPNHWNLQSVPKIAAFRLAGGSGACCNTQTRGCSVISSTACASLGLAPSGSGTTCTAVACSACPPDFDHNGSLQVADIFAFLNAWFAGCP